MTVPTPIYENKRPDLRLIKKATKDVAKVITKNNVIIYESTVYPGVTEEVCIPLIEKISGLKLNKDFYVVIVLKESIQVIKNINYLIL